MQVYIDADDVAGCYFEISENVQEAGWALMQWEAWDEDNPVSLPGNGSSEHEGAEAIEVVRVDLDLNNGIILTDGLNTAKDIITDGNLGIGINSPAERLHVNGSIRGNISGGALRIQTESGYTDIGSKNQNWSHFYTNRAKYYFDKRIHINEGIVSSFDEDLQLQTQGITRLSIELASGNVIVEEGVSAGEVKVLATPGSFQIMSLKDYNLMSLDQLSAYINQNGHLPNIPTAKEVEATGQDLGLIQQKLLEKIEELTLYTIAQEVRIKSLGNTNDALSRELEAIKKQQKEILQLLRNNDK